MSVEITGVGVVNAAGNNAKAYWEALAGPVRAAEPVALFGPEHGSQLLRRVCDDGLDHGYPPRQVKRLDRLTLLASAAIRDALADAQLTCAPGASDRVGIFVGNATGGWAYVEPQLYPLYGEGRLAAINPYVATAWFPTASQGEVSIAEGIGGFSKTFCAENISAAFALRQAHWAIEHGILDVAVVCGAEAPLTPLVYNACVRNGLISIDGSYRPYDDAADGAPLGEAAAAVVLESPASRRARLAPALATVAAPRFGRDHQQVVRDATGGVEVDYVSLEGRAEGRADTAEIRAVTDVLPGAAPAMGTHTGTTGAVLAASFATGVATAVLAVRTGTVPGGTRVFAGPGAAVRTEWRAGEEGTVRSALVAGTDGNGQAGAVLVSRADQAA